MSMKGVTVRAVDDGLEIRQGGSLGARLMGLPLLAAAAYLLWHFVGGLVGLFVPSVGEITVAGAIVLPVFMALVGVPGWLLAVTQKRTLVDLRRREIAEVWDHLIYRHSKARPIPAEAIVRIRVLETQVTGANARTVAYRLVEIPAGADEPIPLATLREHDAEEARAVAADVARLLGVRVEEATPTPTTA
jgi:hypothetical protein